MSTDVQSLIQSVSLMDTVADRRIATLRLDPAGKVACKAGCNHCCHRIVVSSVSELIRIANEVSTTLSAEQRDALIERCRRYADESLPFRDGRQTQARPTCPMLVGGLCSVYEARPLGCRGWSSRDVRACELKLRNPESPAVPMDVRLTGIAQELSRDHAVALADAHLPHHMVDLGLSLPKILEHPELIQEYLAGTPILIEDAVIQAGPDPVLESIRSLKGNKEASGFPPAKPIASHPVVEFLRLSVPTAFSSQENVDRSLSRYGRMIDDLLDTPMDPGEAFDSLSLFQTFGLPYSGEDVTEILKRVGAEIVQPVVTRAFPDLVRPIEPRRREGRLRVGYLSRNFTYHHATNFTLGWISNHEDDLESYVFHIGADQDEYTLKFRIAADHFFHLPGDVPSTARFIKSLELDVLVFPDIGNFGENYQYAAMRLAPVQCTAWGQPVTSGLSTIDYYLSSDLMEPENGQDHYLETLIRLPGSGLRWNTDLPRPSGKSRTELGIPEGLVYLVAQNVRKLAPRWDYLFLEIQARTGAPMIFIDFGTDQAAEITRERLKRIGLQTIWLPRIPQSDFVRMQQLCDVSLDPPAWNGGNTTVYGLNVGSPIVTLPGPFMRSRHSVAFMKQANVEELVAGSPEEYIEMATDPERLRESMKDLNLEVVLRDPAVPPAVDAFMRKAAGLS